MMNPEDLENIVNDLENRVIMLEKAIELLISDCGCSVKERMSGHLVDCPVPHVKDLLYGDGA